MNKESNINTTSLVDKKKELPKQNKSTPLLYLQV